MAKNNKTLDRMQAIWNMIGGDDVADALINGRSKLEITLIQRLKQAGTVTIPATTEKFVAKKRFIRDSAEVKFYGIWDNFTNWFLGGDGVVDKPSEACELHYADLTQASVDGPIIEELGGESKCQTTLSQIFGLLLKQPQGQEDGPLLTNGRANIFYVKDVEGSLCAVRVRWGGVGWSVGAYSVEDPSGWLAGSRVFSAILEA